MKIRLHERREEPKKNRLTLLHEKISSTIEDIELSDISINPIESMLGLFIGKLPFSQVKGIFTLSFAELKEIVIDGGKTIEEVNQFFEQMSKMTWKVSVCVSVKFTEEFEWLDIVFEQYRRGIDRIGDIYRQDDYDWEMEKVLSRQFISQIALSPKELFDVFCQEAIDRGM